jgi:hypothetical protein
MTTALGVSRGGAIRRQLNHLGNTRYDGLSATDAALMFRVLAHSHA